MNGKISYLVTGNSLAHNCPPVHRGAAVSGKSFADRFFVRPPQFPPYHPPARMPFARDCWSLVTLRARTSLLNTGSPEGNINRLSDLAAELVRLKIDCHRDGGGEPPTRAAKASHQHDSDYHDNRWRSCWPWISRQPRPARREHHGAKHRIPADLAGKRLELLKETIPKLSRVAIFSDPRAFSLSIQALKETEAAARLLKVQLTSFEVRSLDELESAFRSSAKSRADGFIIMPSGFFNTNQTRLVELAAKHRLPGMYLGARICSSRRPMTYATSVPDLYRRSATYVDKILKGAKPAELPVEQPIKFEFIINLKAAKQIGLTIPPNVLAESGQGHKIAKGQAQRAKSRNGRNLMRRNDIVFTLSAIRSFALCSSAEAQQPKKIPAIGYLTAIPRTSLGAAPRIEAFRQGLRELGYLEGKNIFIEWRWAAGKQDSLPRTCGRARESQGRHHRLRWFDGNPGRQGCDEHDSHCHVAGQRLLWRTGLSPVWPGPGWETSPVWLHSDLR